MQQGRKERAWGTRVGGEVVGEETGAGQLIGDSKRELGISEEGTKGAEGNKKSDDKAPEGSGSWQEKNSQNAKYRAERMGGNLQRGAEVTKVRHQKSETEGTGGGGKVPE